MAIADMPDFSHSANRSFSRAAPSSIEYSVCTCRWAKPALDRPVLEPPVLELRVLEPSEAAAMNTASFADVNDVAGIGHASRRPRRGVHETGPGEVTATQRRGLDR